MNKFRFTIKILAIAIFAFAFASIAQAQATRTWVSGVGDDANPCSRTAPCKTFAGAISKTAKDGEIDALDPAGFGAVTITKSITIDGSATGVAGLLNSLTNGIIVNVTDPADVRKSVTLRAISINGAGTALDGIKILSASKVFVEHCFIAGQNGSPGNGIEDVRTTVATLQVYDCTIINNNGNGVKVDPSSGSAQINVSISDSRISGNTGHGAFFGSNVHAQIYNCVITQNNAGVFAQVTAGGNTDVGVDHSTVDGNGTGFQANTGSSVIRVSNTNCPHNGVMAVTAGSGNVSSYGNNQTAGNTFPNGLISQQ
jgi:Right handed beta helix region